MTSVLKIVFNVLCRIDKRLELSAGFRGPLYPACSPYLDLFQMLLTLPPEILQYLLGTFCHPRDVALFSMTCHHAEALIHEGPDQYLWRQLFLRSVPFDDPRKSVHSSCNAADAIDWKSELLRRMKAEVIAFSGTENIYERKRALQTFVSVVQDALPTIEGLKSSSDNLQWLGRVLRESQILDEPVQGPDTRLNSQLRSYLALTLEDGKDEGTRTRLINRRTASRCFVYDLRNYHSGSRWGPYMPDGSGRINWVHVEHFIK